MHANPTTEAWHSLRELACLSSTSTCSSLIGSRFSFLMYVWPHWRRWGPKCPITCCVWWKEAAGLGKPVEPFLLTLMLIVGSDRAGRGTNHEPWRWGSDYCAERQLWRSLADPMDGAQHQNNTTQNVTQTFHWWTNTAACTSCHPVLALSLASFDTVNKIRHVRPPSQPFLKGNGQLENSGTLGSVYIHLRFLDS